MKASLAKEHLESRLSLVVKATQYLPPVLLCRRTLTGTRNSQPNHLLPNTAQDRCQGVPSEWKEEATASLIDMQPAPQHSHLQHKEEAPTFSFLQPPVPQFLGGWKPLKAS